MTIEPVWKNINHIQSSLKARIEKSSQRRIKDVLRELCLVSEFQSWLAEYHLSSLTCARNFRQIHSTVLKHRQRSGIIHSWLFWEFLRPIPTFQTRWRSSDSRATGASGRFEASRVRVEEWLGARLNPTTATGRLVLV